MLKQSVVSKSLLLSSATPMEPVAWQVEETANAPRGSLDAPEPDRNYDMAGQ